MSTVRDLIRGSLRLIGATATGETPSADELSDGLSVLNDMIDSWSGESLMIYANVRETFTLIPSQSSYLIGPGAAFNTVRPTAVSSAGIEIQSNPLLEIPLDILNLDQYAQIAVKSTPGTLPTKAYFEDTFPSTTLTLWPVPTVANKVVIYSTKTLTAFASVNDTVSLPPGYAKALRYNLAMELAPEYGKTPDPQVVAGASDSREVVKRGNIEEQLLSCDVSSGAQRSFNWLTGE